jgi:Ca2+-binding RTX toxin-like protein
MAKTPVNIGTRTSNFIIEKSNTHYVLRDGDTISFAEIRTEPAGNIDGIELTIDGTMTGDSRALDIGNANSSGNKLVVGKTGVVDASDEAIIMTGQNSVISNFGTVFATDGASSLAIQSSGDDGRIINSGFIKAVTGIHVTGSGNTVINKGVLVGYQSSEAVVFDSTTGEINRFVNTGHVGAAEGVVGGDGNETVINKGVLGGDIDLGGGNDKLIMTKATGDDIYLGNGDDRAVIRGKGDFTDIYGDAGDDVLDVRGANAIDSGTTIAGGQDDDTYIVTRSDLLLHEIMGQGTDTVKSSVSFNLQDNFENLILTGNDAINAVGNAAANVLTGNAAKNTIQGLAGTDTIDGGGGNDILQGGTHADTFVFRANSGKDLITDFTDVTDKIDLSGYDGIDGFGDLAGKISQNGADTVITLLDGDKITLGNFTATNLTVADFQF